MAHPDGTFQPAGPGTGLSLDGRPGDGRALRRPALEASAAFFE